MSEKITTVVQQFEDGTQVPQPGFIDLTPGGAPSGPAGGGLSGNYPNPSLSNVGGGLFAGAVSGIVFGFVKIGPVCVLSGSVGGPLPVNGDGVPAGCTFGLFCDSAGNGDARYTTNAGATWLAP